MTSAALLEGLPGLPRDAEGPVFREPWEAQAFALAVRLHEQGLFTWPQWAAALADQIKHAQGRGDPDTGETYYRHWLAALEALLADRHVVEPATLDARATAIAAAQQRDHAR